MALPEPKEQFTLAFLGPGTENHSMDVDALIPAFTALNDLVQRMNYLLTRNRVKIKLRVSGFRPGSLEVPLLLEQATYLTAALGVDGGATIRLMAQILLGTKTQLGLFELLKTLRGRPASIIEGKVTPEGETVTVQEEYEGLVVETGRETFRMSADRVVIKTVRNFSNTLREHNLSGVSFRQQGRERAMWTPDAIYDTPTPMVADTKALPDGEKVKRVRRSLTIRELQFGPLASNGVVKWRLHDGESARWYRIADADFLSRVRQGVQFGLHDVLLCEVEERRWIARSGNRRTERTVIQVLGHEKPGWQVQMEET